MFAHWRIYLSYVTRLRNDIPRSGRVSSRTRLAGGGGGGKYYRFHDNISKRKYRMQYIERQNIEAAKYRNSSMDQNIEGAEYRIAKYRICIISNRKISTDKISKAKYRNDEISKAIYRSGRIPKKQNIEKVIYRKAKYRRGKISNAKYQSGKISNTM